MAKIVMKCPSCAGDLELEDSREFGFCTYCGTKIMIQEMLKSKVVIDHSEEATYLYDDLKNYYKIGNMKKVLELARQIEKIDRNNWNVLMFLALFDPEEDEIDYVKFDRAIEACPDEEIKAKLIRYKGYSMILVPQEGIRLTPRSHAGIYDFELPTGYVLLPPGAYYFLPGREFIANDWQSDGTHYHALQNRDKITISCLDRGHSYERKLTVDDFIQEMYPGRSRLAIEAPGYPSNSDYHFSIKTIKPIKGNIEIPLSILDLSFVSIPITGLTEEQVRNMNIRTENGKRVPIESSDDGPHILLSFFNNEQTLEYTHETHMYSKRKITVNKDTKTINGTVHEETRSGVVGLIRKKKAEWKITVYELSVVN